MDSAELVLSELQRISAEMNKLVVVDSARHKQCVHAAALEEVQAVRRVVLGPGAMRQAYETSSGMLNC